MLIDFDALNPFLPAIFFIYGTMLGSFYNVVIGRLPLALLEAEAEMYPEEDEEVEVDIPDAIGSRLIFGLKYIFEDMIWSIAYLVKHFWLDLKIGLKKITFPPSHCPKCSSFLRFYDNLPILSWVFLGARCRACKKPIHWRYPFNEVLTGILFLYIYWNFGLSVESLFMICFLSALQIIFWIDIDHQLILNVITYPGIFLGVIYNFSLGKSLFALQGALIGFLLMQGIALMSIFLLKKEGMGGGDVKLAIMLGAWMGTLKLIVALFLSFLIGAIIGGLLLMVRDRSEPFPFGPAIVMGALISLEKGQQIWNWYFNFIYY